MFDVDDVDHACHDAAAARVAAPPIAVYAPRIRPWRPRRQFSPRLPRTALGMLAIAMTAITMTALVLVPVAIDSVAHTLY